MKRGLSLVEVLVALVVMVLVFSIIFVLYETVSRLQLFQQAESRPASQTVQALHTLSVDLSRSVYVSAADCKFSLSVSNNFPSLSFCAALAEEDEDDLRWHGLVLTRYWVSAKESQPVLLQSRQPIAGPGAFLNPVTNQLVQGISSFEVEAFDGEEWHEEWSNRDPRAWPESMRLRLATRGQEAETTQVTTPFGSVVESKIERVR